jgi:hypothetical protein
MGSKFDKGKIVNLALAAITGLTISACGVGVKNNSTPTQELAIETPVIEANPYLPNFNRLTTTPLPSDVIDGQNLWKSFHARIWQNSDTRLMLRAGVQNSDLFKALANREIKSLDIILLEEGNTLTDEQRRNLPAKFVKEYDSWPEVSDDPGLQDKRFSGMIYPEDDGRYYMLLRHYSAGENVDSLKSFPEASDVTNSTLWSTFRHELNHFPARTEAGTGYRTMDDLIDAQKKLKTGDNSGFYCLTETKEGLVFG